MCVILVNLNRFLAKILLPKPVSCNISESESKVVGNFDSVSVILVTTFELKQRYRSFVCNISDSLSLKLCATVT